MRLLIFIKNLFKNQKQNYKKNLVLNFVIGLMLIVIPGCSQDIQNGSLMLSIDYSRTDMAKTYVPNVNMEPYSYEISMTGPNSATKTAEADSSGAVIIEDLIPGAWTITVTALNSDNVAIGSGVAVATILPRQTVSCNITITPFEGTGTLNLTITWDTNLVTSASIAGHIAPSTGSASQIDFTLTGGANNYVNNTLASGYYILSITLSDNGIVCGGGTDVIRIISEQTTNANINISASSANGSINITIVSEMYDPIEITLTGDTTVIEGQTFTATAVALNASGIVTSWYIDGNKIESANLSTYAIPTDLALGGHRLDVTMLTFDGLRGGSASHNFTVVPE